MTETMTRPFTISRIFDAPRDRVWRAWTEVEQLQQWWGPLGFVVTYCKLDLRPGGLMHYCLRAPDGSEIWGRFAYREIVKPERLVWINAFSDKDGGLTTHPMSPTWPREMHTTVTFKALGGKTEVTVEWLPVEGSTDLERATFEAGRPSMTMGWSGTMEQFAAFLAKAR
jgi:uncharacterized protein YndB with AHSA1/START domain